MTGPTGPNKARPILEVATEHPAQRAYDRSSPTPTALAANLRRIVDAPWNHGTESPATDSTPAQAARSPRALRAPCVHRIVHVRRHAAWLGPAGSGRRGAEGSRPLVKPHARPGTFSRFCRCASFSDIEPPCRRIRRLPTVGNATTTTATTSNIRSLSLSMTVLQKLHSVHHPSRRRDRLCWMAAGWRPDGGLMAICLGHRERRGGINSAVFEPTTGRLADAPASTSPTGGRDRRGVDPCAQRRDHGYVTELVRAAPAHAFSALDISHLLPLIRARQTADRLFSDRKCPCTVCLAYTVSGRGADGVRPLRLQQPGRGAPTQGLGTHCSGRVWAGQCEQTGLRRLPARPGSSPQVAPGLAGRRGSLLWSNAGADRKLRTSRNRSRQHRPAQVSVAASGHRDGAAPARRVSERPSASTRRGMGASPGLGGASGACRETHDLSGSRARGAGRISMRGTRRSGTVNRRVLGKTLVPGGSHASVGNGPDI